MIVWTFIKKYWKYIAMGLLILVIFILGIVAGASAVKNKRYLEEQKESKALIKSLNHEIDSLKVEFGKLSTEHQALLDSADIYESKSNEARRDGTTIRNQTNKILYDTKAEMHAAGNLPYDSAVSEFSRLAEEYLRNPR